MLCLSQQTMVETGVWFLILYEKEVLCQPCDQQCYKRLFFNLLASFQELLQGLPNTAIEESTITHDCFYVEHSIVACFYLLPNIYKDMAPPPRRPTMSGNVNICEPLCK